MNWMRVGIILIGCILLGIALAPFVFATTILIEPGTGEQTNPPGDDIPTTDYVECPEGYDCIRSEDYTEFISSLKDFTTEIGERTQFIEDVFDRFDEKIRVDEEFISSLVEITSDAQAQSQSIKDEFDRLQKEKVANEVLTNQRIHKLETQLAEIRASWMAWFIVFLGVAIIIAGILQQIKPHVYFYWKRIQELLPFKLG